MECVIDKFSCYVLLKSVINLNGLQLQGGCSMDLGKTMMNQEGSFNSVKGRLLVLATYGMEFVQCGGTLAKHVSKGWHVHVAVLICREEFHDEVRAAAEVLGVSVEFLGFQVGSLDLSIGTRARLVEVIRQTRPDTVVFYDPEYASTDLDPERRYVNILVPEALSCSGREIFPEHGPPHTVPSVYYMTPLRPNCVVDISSFIKRKVEALGKLRYQMVFTGKEAMERYGPDVFNALGEADPGDDYGRGLLILSKAELGHSLHYGLGDHGTPALVEAFRKEGNMLLQELR